MEAQRSRGATHPIVCLLFAEMIPIEFTFSNPIDHGTALVVVVAEDGIALGQDHLRAAGTEITKPIIQKFSFLRPSGRLRNIRPCAT
jgi:hypothetical protein